MVHRIYLSPGMFGFGHLASYNYFAHVKRALEERLATNGDKVQIHVVDVPPTASVRRRAAIVATHVARTCGEADGGPIHLLGHSTGGLDARLVASPSVRLPVEARDLVWLPRLASVTTMNTPHYGTPLAGFFATLSGQRMLQALSAMTIIGLSVGAPPMAAVSGIIAALGGIDRKLGVEIRVLDRAMGALLRAVDETRSREVRQYLDGIKQDQAAVIQVTPEAMDLFQAGIEDQPGVLYQSTASMAPPPTAAGWAKKVIRPWDAMSHAVFTTLYELTVGYHDERYPCSAPDAGAAAEATLARAFERLPGSRANDGVVPIRSQIWGELSWAGYADHLDVLGHFKDVSSPPRADEKETPEERAARHVDWLSSGALFDRAKFAAVMDAIALGLRRGSSKPT